MSVEENKAIVRDFFEQVLNRGDAAAIGAFCVEGSMYAGGVEGQLKVMKTAFPDMTRTIEEIVAEGDKVCVRATVHGTNMGPMSGFAGFGQLSEPVPPTGKAMSATELHFFTVKGSRITSQTVELDQIGILRQLGWSFTPPE